MKFKALTLPRKPKQFSLMDNTPTPKKIYDELDKEFHFDHDPCPINPEGLRERDGFGDWGKSNFVNPPYSDKLPWIKKALEEVEKGHLTVMLLPVDTSTGWFLDYVLPNCEIRFVRGRISFRKDSHAAYASMLCIFGPSSIRFDE